MDNVLFVTALFNLTPYDNYTARRSIEDYLKCGTNLLLQNIHLVIFLDSSLKDKFQDLLNSIQVKCQLEIISVDITTLPLWSERATLREAKKPDLWNGRFTAEYILLMYSKFYFVDKVIQSHSKSHYIWIDFGLTHVTPPEDLSLLSNIPLTDKFRICKYWTHCYPTCVNKDLILNTVWSQTPGGLWMTTPENFKQVHLLFNGLVQELLQTGRVAVDEDILTYLRCQYPELFDSFYGTYQSLIRSFCGQFCMNEWNLTQNLKNLQASGRKEDLKEAFLLAQKSLRALMEKKLSLSNECFTLITQITTTHLIQ